MKLNEIVAKRIKSIMKKHNLTQYALSKITGIPQSTLSTIIKCNVKTIYLSTIYDICSGLNIEIKEFFNFEDFSLENIID